MTFPRLSNTKNPESEKNARTPFFMPARFAALSISAKICGYSPSVSAGISSPSSSADSPNGASTYPVSKKNAAITRTVERTAPPPSGERIFPAEKQQSKRSAITVASQATAAAICFPIDFSLSAGDASVSALYCSSSSCSCCAVFAYIAALLFLLHAPFMIAMTTKAAAEPPKSQRYAAFCERVATPIAQAPRQIPIAMTAQSILIRIFLVFPFIFLSVFSPSEMRIFFLRRSPAPTPFCRKRAPAGPSVSLFYHICIYLSSVPAKFPLSPKRRQKAAVRIPLRRQPALHRRMYAIW